MLSIRNTEEQPEPLRERIPRVFFYAVAGILGLIFAIVMFVVLQQRYQECIDHGFSQFYCSTQK
jgi:multisubunit Na+/H+ antiporter MnhB subunit